MKSNCDSAFSLAKLSLKISRSLCVSRKELQGDLKPRKKYSLLISLRDRQIFICGSIAMCDQQAIRVSQIL